MRWLGVVGVVPDQRYPAAQPHPFCASERYKNEQLLRCTWSAERRQKKHTLREVEGSRGRRHITTRLRRSGKSPSFPGLVRFKCPEPLYFYTLVSV